MRVLLTGASGFVGAHVLGQLLESGVDVIVIGRSRPAGYTGSFISADLLECGELSELIQGACASHLIHLAWYTEHGQYWNSPLNLRWVEASVRLVEGFCAAGGQKVVTAGTCAEYDWNFGLCQEDSTPLNPATLYGTAKDATRRLLEAVCKHHKAKCAWGRIFLLYGKGEDPRRLIPSLIDVFEGRRPPFGVNATACRDFLSVNDVASALIRLLSSDAQGCYNISSGTPTQIAEVVREIASDLRADPRVILDLCSERLSEPNVLFGDNRKLTALGWYPTQQITNIALLEEDKHGKP